MKQDSTTVTTTFTINHVLLRLSERMSSYNARLMLTAAMLKSGVEAQENELSSSDAKAICLALINKGGPSFQVGQDLHRVLQ